MKIKVADIAQGKLAPEEAKALQKYFKEGGTWQSLLQLKPNEVEGMYAVGHGHYQKGEFDKALACFSGLIQLNPYEPKHWVAIGATLQAKEEYTDALYAYELVLALDKGHIAVLFYSAQCCYALEKKAECVEFLHKVVAASPYGEEGSFGEKASEILEMMEREGER